MGRDDDGGRRGDPRRFWRGPRCDRPQQTKAFAEQFRDTPLLVAIVGDRERVGLDALEKIGKVTEVTADQLFSYGEFPDKKEPEPKAKPKQGKVRGKFVPGKGGAAKGKGPAAAPK